MSILRKRTDLYEISTIFISVWERIKEVKEGFDTHPGQLFGELRANPLERLDRGRQEFMTAVWGGFGHRPGTGSGWAGRSSDFFFEQLVQGFEQDLRVQPMCD